MLIFNKNTYEDIFDLILTQALEEDCNKENALYNDNLNKHIFSDKYNKSIKIIEKYFKKKQNIEKLKKSVPKLTTAAAAVIVCITLATNPVVHAFIRNIIVRLSDGFNQHEFIDDTIITIENFNQELRPAYLPEGYQIFLALYSPTSMIIDFINQRENIEDDTVITLEYGIAGDAAFSVDVKNIERHYILINGKEAIFYETTTEDRMGYLFWNIGGYAFVLSAQIEMHEFVKIAESIKIS
jgi:hypothetical protein